MKSKVTEKINFTKMHGLGNDYIYVNVMDSPIKEPAKVSMEWSVPHKGIGSDGLVLIDQSDIADFKMSIFNADGSEAMMCGNATRCIGKYVYEKGLTDKKIITLETLSGIKTIALMVKDKKVKSVTVDMGAPVVKVKDKTISIEGKTYYGTVVSMGNPHIVFFVDDMDKLDLPVVGPQVETHPAFPDRINVEFVQVLDDHRVRMRVWERGSGITMACGTGACATAVACVVNEKAKSPVTVVMDGGCLSIAWDSNKEGSSVMMTGGATTVFEGTIDLNYQSK